ncbi:MAG: hypothetical protein JNK93_03180 [Planctomycetia bacterium]|nr:hypothetical protein [Planctomycetia bacterium]
MQRRFGIWAAIAFALFAASSVFGWVLTASIGPRSPNYGRFVPAPPPPPPPIVRRNTTVFLPPRKPSFPESAGFTNVLNDLASRAKNRTPFHINDIFDTPRMAEEEVALGLYDFFGQTPQRSVVDQSGADILADLTTLVSDHPDTFPPGRIEIRQVMWSRDGAEAIVLAKHMEPTAGTRWTRWWMLRRPIGWRVYDFDFPDTRLRFLAVRNYLLSAPVRDHAGAGPNRNADPNAPDVDAYFRYQNAFGWLQLAGSATDPAGANSALWAESIDAVPMLPDVQAARRVLRARQFALRGDAAKAEAALVGIPDSLATAAHVRFAQAVIANARKKPAEARAAIRAYRELVGDDPIAVLEDAKAAAALDGAGAGVAVLRAGLKEFPGDASLAMELARRLPAEDRAGFGEELAKSAKPELLLTAATLFEKQFPTILDSLCTGWLKAQPNDGIVLTIGVTAKLAVGQTKAATDLLKRVPDGLRKDIANDLIRRATFAVSPNEIFTILAGAGEGKLAFRRIAQTIGNQLVHGNLPPADRARRAQHLKSLIALHRAADPNDAQLHYAEAAILIAADEHDKADTELAAGLAKLPIARTDRLSLAEQAKRFDDEREPLRALRVDRLARRGRWQTAYAEVAPVVDTFDQLSQFLAAQRDEFALAGLLERHAAARPDDLELVAWRAELAYLKRENETALKLYREYRDKSGLDNRHLLRIHERMIRCLVRLNRPDEAAEALDEAGDLFGRGLVLPVLVTAAKGDVDGVLEQFDSAGPFNPTIWYSDPDIGPLLRKPAFERLRQKYPPPVR